MFFSDNLLKALTEWRVRIHLLHWAVCSAMPVNSLRQCTRCGTNVESRSAAPRGHRTAGRLAARLSVVGVVIGVLPELLVAVARGRDAHGRVRRDSEPGQRPPRMARLKLPPTLLRRPVRVLGGHRLHTRTTPAPAAARSGHVLPITARPYCPASARSDPAPSVSLTPAPPPSQPLRCSRRKSVWLGASGNEKTKARQGRERCRGGAGGRAGGWAGPASTHLAPRRGGRCKRLGWAGGVATAADGDVDDAWAREPEDVDAAVAAGADAHRRRRVAAEADWARVGQAVPRQAVVAPVAPAAHAGSGGGPRAQVRDLPIAPRRRRRALLSECRGRRRRKRRDAGAWAVGSDGQGGGGEGLRQFPPPPARPPRRPVF